MSTETETMKESKEAKQPKPMTQAQFDEAVRKATESLVEEKVAQFMAKQVITTSPAIGAVVEEEGETVPPGYVPRDKRFRVTKMNDGSLELKLKSQKSGFNPVEREVVINTIAADYKEMTRDVAGQPKPTPPVRLLVNAHFRKLFNHVMRWGDTTDIIVESDDKAETYDFKTIPKSEVRYQFIR